MAGTPRSTTDSSRDRVNVFVLGSALATLVLSIMVFVLSGVWSANDFRHEAAPAYALLAHGDLLGFVRVGPLYVGSLILRAPFALAASAFGAGTRAIYFASALPCLMAGVLLGAWLSVRPGRQSTGGPFSRVSPIVLCALNPLVIVSLYLGHPEEVLGATLCVAAVVLASRGKADLAGFLLGLALINKFWALVAVPVVFAALPAGRRRALLTMTLTAGLVLIPVVLIRQSGANPAGAAASLGSPVGNFLLTPQLLWWFGRGSWVVQQAHFLIVLVAVGCAGLWWRFRGRTAAAATEQLLILLALVLLLRAALDPEDNLYYHVPFLFAVMAYEARRPPVLTMLCTVLLVVVVPPKLLPLSPDLHALLYAVGVIPLIVWLIVRSFGPGFGSVRLGGRGRRAALAGGQRD